jgi:orotate phosphoribosyltransferase
VNGILALVDREEGGRGLLEQQGFEVHCLTSLSELLGGNEVGHQDG